MDSTKSDNTGLFVFIGAGPLGILAYWGIQARDVFFRSRYDAVQKAIEEGSDLPAGLNRQYPADGPMARYYEEHPELGVEVEP